MGRPQTPLGAYEKVRFIQRPSGAWQARTLFRDLDGRTRPISRNGLSRAAAERALKLAVSKRPGSAHGDGSISPNIKIADLADYWLGSAVDLSVNTTRVYKSVVRTRSNPHSATYACGRSTRAS